MSMGAVGMLGAAPGMGPDGRTIFPGSINSAANNNNNTIAAAVAGGGNVGINNSGMNTPPSANTQNIVNPVFSPQASQITKTIRDPRAASDPK